MNATPDIPSGFEDLRGRTFQERYAVSELLASTGWRVTFAGTEGAGGRPVVLELIRPPALHDEATLERFVRRVRACGRIRHPALAGPIDSGETFDGKLYLVYERPAGAPLELVLAAQPSHRLAWAAARPLLLELVRGLAAVHARKVVHGSMSPRYCWVHGVGSGAPTLRILGLGASIEPDHDAPEAELSRTTTVGGDPVFMAPECVGGVLGDERADVYLAGLVAYTMLVGRPPFQALNAFQVAAMHIQAAVPTMRESGAEVPAAVEALVRGLLAKEPAQRPTMSDVERVILGLDELGLPRQVGPGELDEPRGRRGAAKAGAARASSRDEAVQQLDPGKPGAGGRGGERRLPGQEMVDPRGMRSEPVRARVEPVAPPSSLPAEVEGTLLLEEPRRVAAVVAAPPSVAAEVEGTMLLAVPPRAAAAEDLEATLFMVQRGGAMPDATMMLSSDAAAAGPAATEATMMLPAAATEGTNATMALTMDPALFLPQQGLNGGARPPASDVAQRGGTSVVSRPALHAAVAWAPEPRAPVAAYHSTPLAPEGHAPNQSAFVSPAPVPPAPVPPVHPGVVVSQGSRLGPVIVILAVIAAVAGIVVGMVLGGG